MLKIRHSSMFIAKKLGGLRMRSEPSLSMLRAPCPLRALDLIVHHAVRLHGTVTFGPSKVPELWRVVAIYMVFESFGAYSQFQTDMLKFADVRRAPRRSNQSDRHDV